MNAVHFNCNYFLAAGFLYKKLPASDALRHPYPFRDMTDESALTRSFLSLIGSIAMPAEAASLGVFSC